MTDEQYERLRVALERRERYRKEIQELAKSSLDEFVGESLERSPER